MKKKILLLSWSDAFGGASQAALEIYKSLKRKIKINFFVQKKITSFKFVKTYKKKTLNLILRNVFSFLSYKMRFSKHDHSLNIINSDITKIANFNKYEIINIHWFNSETLSIKDLSKIKSKIVLTLHDMWAFCGTEHYLYEQPSTYFKRGKNINISKIDYKIWKKKRNNWKKKFNIVAPSNWLAKLIKNSKLFFNFPVTVIPYPVDKKIFFKKKVLNLKFNNKNIFKNEKIDILFISASRLFNFRKGFELLDNAINKSNLRNQVRLIIVGPVKEKDKKKIITENIVLGEINDKKFLNNIYNFSDILGLPSRIDNLPNVGLEAHSCGLPIIAFDVGGIPDIVSHKKTGYLAKPFQLKDLMNGIHYILKNKKRLNKNSLQKSKIWDPKLISKKYQKLFKNI